MAVIIISQPHRNLRGRIQFLRKKHFGIFDPDVTDEFAKRSARFPLDKLVNMILMIRKQLSQRIPRQILFGIGLDIFKDTFYRVASNKKSIIYIDAKNWYKLPRVA
jgi:hypothetical protein